jgi:hypothetical protein
VAILSVNEIWDARQGSRDGRGVRDYKRTYRVLTSTALDGPLQVGQLAGNPLPGPVTIPPLLSYYIDLQGVVDYGAYVMKWTPRQTEDPFTWLVDVEYSSDIRKLAGTPGKSGKSGKAEQARDGGDQANPLSRPPVFTFSSEKFQKPIDQDVGGFPITNSCGEKFDPSPQIDDSRAVLSIERNEAAMTVAQYVALQLKYKDALNSDQFAGQLAGMCRMEMPTGQSCFENGLFYYRMTYKVTFADPDLLTVPTGLVIGWTLYLLDHGYHHLDPNTGLPVPNFDSISGVMLPNKNLLDGHGNQLIQTSINTNISAGVVTVAPLSMNGIVPTMKLLVDPTSDAKEIVAVSATTPTTFTATFVNNHISPPTRITGAPAYFRFGVYKSVPFAPLQLIPPGL